MWDEADGFFYDVLRLPDGNATRLKSLAGRAAAAGACRWRRTADRLPAPFEFERAPLPGVRNPDLLAQHALDVEGCTDAAARRGRPATDPPVLARMLDENGVPEPVRHPGAVARHPPSTLRVPGRGDVPRRLPARRSRRRPPLRRQLELARPMWMPINVLLIRALVSRRVLRRRRSPSSARRAPGREDDALRGRRGDHGASRRSSCRRGRSPSLCSAARRRSGRSRTSAT